MNSEWIIVYNIVDAVLVHSLLKWEITLLGTDFLKLKFKVTGWET